jgi:hypothetical protein
VAALVAAANGAGRPVAAANGTGELAGSAVFRAVVGGRAAVGLTPAQPASSAPSSQAQVVRTKRMGLIVRAGCQPDNVPTLDNYVFLGVAHASGLEHESTTFPHAKMGGQRGWPPIFACRR